MSATVEAVRERPILFSGEMVRAILDGHKTQTRRVMVPQPVYLDVVPEEILSRTEARVGEPGWWWTRRDGTGVHSQRDERAFAEIMQRCLHWCPYGQPGDQLWVRETWASLVFEREWESGIIDGWHPASDPRQGHVVYDADPHGFNDGGDNVADRGFAWRPSIFMPRWASRLTLEVTNVRVERLQAITANDCIAEGIESRGMDRDGPNIASAIMYISDYQDLWDSLNAKRGYGWDVNPWVWVIDFRPVAPSPAPGADQP